jgi:hypothetical protein
MQAKAQCPEELYAVPNISANVVKEPLSALEVLSRAG